MLFVHAFVLLLGYSEFINIHKHTTNIKFKNKINDTLLVSCKSVGLYNKYFLFPPILHIDPISVRTPSLSKCQPTSFSFNEYANAGDLNLDVCE